MENPRMKKPKLTETVSGDDGSSDGISKLPDSLLSRILSLLPSTKAAFRTCLVSKRWKYLWTSVDKLILDFHEFTESENFVSFIDHVFARRNYSKITLFYLDFWDMTSYRSHIDQWLSYVIRSKVEHVFLQSDSFTKYMLPQSFYTSSSLVTLSLTGCAFDNPVVISWKCLKKVKFTRVKLDDESFVKLLSGSPSLEALELTYFCGFRRLEINNSDLKTLKLESFQPSYDGSDHSLEIVAPYLEHLEISRDLHNLKCRLVNVSSLVSAKLTFNIECHNTLQNGSCRDYHHVLWTIVQDYLRKLRHVKELTIGTWFVEALFILQLDGVQLPELNCKCLTLKLHITNNNLCGVATLLRASPHVETLNIDMHSDAIKLKFLHCQYMSSYLRQGDNIDLENWISDFAFPNLKSVNIIFPTFGMCWMLRHDKLFELSKFILKHAKVLEKFVIMAKRTCCTLCSKNCVSPYSSQLAAKLLGCQRPPTNFMTSFHES